MAPRRLHPNPVKTRLTTFLPFVLDELMGTAFSVALPFGLDELMETAFSVVPTAHVGWLKPATPPRPLRVRSGAVSPCAVRV